MPTQSRGTCAYCGYETTKGAMARHLDKCPVRQERIAAAAQGKAKPETIYHLRVQDAHAKNFWLDLEVNGSAKLEAIDRYLRAIWLECCGHLSQFSVGGWSGDEIAKSRRVEAVFKTAPVLTHIYDFGTSSETLLQLVGQRTGAPTTRHPVALMARNLMPVMPCIECGQPATHVCMECLIEHDSEGFLCAQHAESHPHEDYGEPLGLVNSPRMGMCGYVGPAEPPY